MSFARLAIVLSLACSAHAANEAALLELWNQHIAKPDDHDAAIKACRAFAEVNANDPLLPIAHGIEAWHHFRAGRDADALKLTEPYLTAPAGAVNDGARRIALGWFTRLDREKVAAALQIYYRKNVAFPKSLDQLTKPPPLSDRFGKPWAYQLTGFTKLRGFADQKYSLQSSTLGDWSEMKAAIAAPYASRITATPAQLVANAVRFDIPGKGASVIGVGQAAGDLHLAFVGSQIIVVCDFTHWKVFPRP